MAGVKRTTFNEILGTLKESVKNRKTQRGTNKKLNIENILLMALAYLGEYRTYFHVSQSDGASESSAFKSIKWGFLPNPK